MKYAGAGHLFSQHDFAWFTLICCGLLCLPAVSGVVLAIVLYIRSHRKA